MSTPTKRRSFSTRQLAVGLAGYCAFINLYSPQAVLPLLARESGIIADFDGWRAGMLALAVATLAGALAVALLLPREKKFVRSEGLIASARQMLRHFRNPQLLATYAVGFGVLFNFIATFTYVSFQLAAAPYNLSPTLLGMIFVVYLVGTALTPMTGWAVGRFGRRDFMIGTIC